MHLANMQTTKSVLAEFYMAISNEISTNGLISRTGVTHTYPEYAKLRAQRALRA